VVSVSLMWW